MIRMSIGANNPYLEELQSQLAKLGMGSMPRTAGALKAGAKFIQDTWRGYAAGERSLPGVTPLKNPSMKYAGSIKVSPNGPFQYEIASKARIAEQIENGTEELDMKRTHPFGPRSRMSKSTGYPYVIIPFRWGTPEGSNGKRVGFGKNVMTAGAYKTMIKKSFKPSRVTASANTSGKQTPNARGEMVGRAQYDWGSRHKTGAADDKSIEAYMNGMVRFENGLDSNGNVGGKRYGGYFTFRVISADPESKGWKRNGWIKPATPARNVTKGVREYTEETIEDMVGTAIRGDLGV